MTWHDAARRAGEMPTKTWRTVILVVIILCFALTPISLTLAIKANSGVSSTQQQIFKITNTPCSLAHEHPHNKALRRGCDKSITVFVKSLGPHALHSLADGISPYLSVSTIGERQK